MGVNLITSASSLFPRKAPVYSLMTPLTASFKLAFHQGSKTLASVDLFGGLGSQFCRLSGRDTGKGHFLAEMSTASDHRP